MATANSCIFIQYFGARQLGLANEPCRPQWPAHEMQALSSPMKTVHFWLYSGLRCHFGPPPKLQCWQHSQIGATFCRAECDFESL
jgi:hypothetical protein